MDDGYAQIAAIPVRSTDKRYGRRNLPAALPRHWRSIASKSEGDLATLFDIGFSRKLPGHASRLRREVHDLPHSARAWVTGKLTTIGEGAVKHLAHQHGGESSEAPGYFV